MDAYLRAKFEIFSIILTSFRERGEVILPPGPTSPQNEPLKSPPRLGLMEARVSCLSIQQKYSNSKQKTQKQNIMHCV